MQLDVYEKRLADRKKHEAEILEAWEGQINNMDDFVNSASEKLNETQVADQESKINVVLENRESSVHQVEDECKDT